MTRIREEEEEGQLPCTFFRACRGGPNFRNPYKIKKDRASEDDNDDCAEADGDIDLMME